MQARQLNKLIKRARERAGENGKWQQHLPAVWAETPLKKIGDNKIRDYASFAEHDLIKRLLGLRYAQNQYLPYDEQPVEENDEYLTPDDVLETLAESDHEAEYLAEIALLAERLNTAALTPRDRALLFAIVHQRDFSHLIAEDEDEDALFAHLGEQLRQLQRAHNSEEK